MKRIVLPIIALFAALAATSFADQPKGYSVTLPSATVGTATLNAGEYRILVHRDESKVELQNVRTGDKIDVAAKLQTLDKKVDKTEVYSQDVNGVKQILRINLGGSKFCVEFQQGL